MGYSDYGAGYGVEGSRAYVLSPSSFDRDRLINSHILDFLQKLDKLTLLDAGCGPGHFALKAGQSGAKVFAIDINENMIIAAIKAVCEENLVSQVSLDVGTVASLPYRSALFDRAISINVACNISSSAVGQHFQEMSRVLKKGGLAMLIVPISLDVVFTHQKLDEKQAYESINQVLNKLPDDPAPAQIYSELMSLKEIVNATFGIKNGRLTLITNKNELSSGQEIWRKLPVLVVPNYYHSEEEYQRLISRANLKIDKVICPYFINKKDRLEYNKNSKQETSFGKAYEEHAPYAIYYLKKK